MTSCATSTCSCSAWVNPAWRWRAGACATAPGARVGLARAPAACRRAGAELPQVTLFGGDAERRCLAGVQLVLKSPGLAPHDARIAPLLHEARATGIAVLAELDLFARALADLKKPQGYAPKVLAITGTNGKTTTTAMTALLVAARRQARGDGRQHRPDHAGHADRARWTTCPRLGAGAFQLPLEGVRCRRCCRASSSDAGFEPSAATVLNLTQDHLDWHGDMAAYGGQGARLWPARADGHQPRRPAGGGHGARAGAHGQRPRQAPPRSARSCASAWTRRSNPGDFGLVVENGMAWLVRALPTTKTSSAARAKPKRSTCSA
jgi:UDP-N-acetylmuramoylalanine--D-glutamate ligase